MKLYDTDTGLISAYGSNTLSATTAGTTLMVPSTATGRIHITDIIMSNGATTAGWAYFGYGVGATAPTTTAILIQNCWSAANTTLKLGLETPLVLPALTNFVITTVTFTTMGCTVLWYIAP